MYKDVRILKRTSRDGEETFVIQQKDFLFRRWWVDAWVNFNWFCQYTFDSIEEAMKHLCYHDGTRGSEIVVFEERHGSKK